MGQCRVSVSRRGGGARVPGDERSGMEWSEVITDESGAFAPAKCRELARWPVHAKRPEAKRRRAQLTALGGFVIRGC